MIRFDFTTFIPISKSIEPRREKSAFCICENKDADQLRGNREADQRLCFRYTDSTIYLSFLNPEFQASSHLLFSPAEKG